METAYSTHTQEEMPEFVFFFSLSLSLSLLELGFDPYESKWDTKVGLGRAPLWCECWARLFIYSLKYAYFAQNFYSSSSSNTRSLAEPFRPKKSRSQRSFA